MLKNNVLKGMLALIVALGLGMLGCGGAEGSEAPLPADQLATGQVIADLSQGPAAYELAAGQDLSRVSVITQPGVSSRLDELLAKSGKAQGVQFDKAPRVVVTNSQEKAAQLFPGYQFQAKDTVRTQLTAGGECVTIDAIIIVVFDDGSVLVLVICSG
jgi:hypothetical protein